MSNKVIYGLYDDDDILLKGVKELRAAGVRIREVYTPFPVHGLDKAMGLKDTRIAIAAFMYGLLGLSFAGLMMYFMMVVDWPQNIGGKPSFTFYENLPAFVPIMFECTVLFAGHLMVITFLARNGMYPGREAMNPDPRTTDHLFMVELPSGDNRDEVISILEKTGAVEINEKELTDEH